MLPGVFPPPEYDGPFVSYEWAGAPHDSESIKKVDGVEVARNRAVNPSFEVSATAGLVLGSRVNTHGRTSVVARVQAGTYSAGFSWAEDATQIQTTVQTEVDAAPGQWVAVSLWATSSNGQIYADGIISERTATGHLAHHYQGVYQSIGHNEMTRIVYAVQVNNQSVQRARVGLRFSGTEGSYTVPASGYGYLDAFHIAVADTEQAALAQVSEYFDGDTPDVVPNVVGDPSDVVELTTYAIVNDVRRDIESVSLDAELTGDMPDQVVAAGGVSGRSGTIRWAVQDDAVQAREPSPWHKPVGWPPSAGDRVQVHVTDGTTSYPRFTGVIDKTTGSVGGRMESRIIDFRDRLNCNFTHAALLRHHVPYSEGDDYRSIGLRYWYPLVMALRRARIFNTPPAVAEIAVSAPMQASVWAEAGTVEQAIGTVPGTHAAFHRAPWGYAAGGFNVRYLPRTAYNPAQPLQVTLMVADDHAANATVDVYYGPSYRVRLLALGSRAVVAYRDSEEICRLTTAQMDGATIVTLLVKAGAWTLRNNRGQQATGTRGAGSSAGMSLVHFNAAENSRVAGMQVSRPNSTTHEFSSMGFTPAMTFDAGNLSSSMDMMPRLENQNVADLVDEICKATLTAAWFDESGVLRFAQSDRLRGASSVQTVTTLDDITGMGWEDSLLSVRSRVDVDWKNPAISKGRYLRKELFRAPGDTMEAADTNEVFATPDDSTEWLGADRNPRRLDDTNWGVYNRRRGSFIGAYFTNADDDELSTAGRPLTITTELLGTTALKIIHTAGALGTGIEANLGTSENSNILRQVLRGEALPVIRGFGEGTWVDDTYTSPTTGPSYAPALTHNLGYWGHEFFEGGSVAQRIGDYLAGMVTTPSPTLTGVTVTYDPRRQLGDVITIESGLLDVTIRALVVGVSETHSPGEHTQTLTVRVISVTSTRRVTYHELETAWTGGTYAGLEAVWAGLTYSDFENDPLEGAPNQ